MKDKNYIIYMISTDKKNQSNEQNNLFLENIN